MKKKLVLAGLIGIVVGAVVAVAAVAIFVRPGVMRSYAMYDTVGEMSLANVAWQIRAGHAQELLATIDAELPGVVVHASQNRALYPPAIDPLWMVQRYYQHFNLKIPNEIRPIMDSLPPRPLTSCEKRARAKAAAAAKKAPVKTASAP